MSVWHYEYKNFASSAADTYEYTGVSLTIPSYQVYEIFVSDRFSNAAPWGIMISNDPNPANLSVSGKVYGFSEDKPSTNANLGARCLGIMTSRTSSAETYYVFVKRSGTGTNPISFAYRRID